MGRSPRQRHDHVRRQSPMNNDRKLRPPCQVGNWVSIRRPSRSGASARRWRITRPVRKTALERSQRGRVGDDGSFPLANTAAFGRLPLCSSAFAPAPDAFSSASLPLARSHWSATGSSPMANDASLIAAPRQRNPDGEKAVLKAGRTAQEIWPDKPAKVAQKDTNARSTIKYSKAKSRADGSRPVDPAIPAFGYKSHISIDRQNRVRTARSDQWRSGPHSGGRSSQMLRSTTALVCAKASYRRRIPDAGSGRIPPAYQSFENEAWAAANGMVSEIHHKEPHGWPMSARTFWTNGRKSVVRSKVGHVFGPQKDRMGLSSGPSARPAPRRRSRWPTWSVTWGG